MDGPKLRAAADALRKALGPIGDLTGEATDFETLEAAAGYQSADEDKKAADAFLLQRLPTFIYFEDYGRLETKIHLPTFIQQKGQKPPEPRVRTQVALFEWANLSAEELRKLGRLPDSGESRDSVERRKEERGTLLESSSYALTGEWVNWWDQHEHRLHVEADGDDLVLKVADTENPWKVAFHERSKGFQWFFSFYLTFLVESERSHHGAILLLDEPGLHLHIRAQQKLLAFFQKISEKNQLLYTSHSPFLVDPDKLDNVRTVFLKKDDDGARFHTRVAIGTEPGGDRDTVLPLQAAVGYELAQTLFMGKTTLVVEGFADYMLLKYLSDYLGAAKRACLPDDTAVIFAGGTSHILPLVSLFSRPDEEGRRLVVMLDADRPGQQKAQQLRRELLCQDGAVALLSEPDFLGTAEAEIEDILDRQELLSAVRDVRGEDPKLPTPAPDMNVPFLKALYEANGWGALANTEKAKLVLAVIEAWRKGSQPSTETLTNAEKVFAGLRQRFE